MSFEVYQNVEILMWFWKVDRRQSHPDGAKVYLGRDPDDIEPPRRFQNVDGIEMRIPKQIPPIACTVLVTARRAWTADWFRFLIFR